MKDLPSGYQILEFGPKKQIIDISFNVSLDFKITKDLNLDIRIIEVKEFKGQLVKINDKYFENGQFDFLITIPKSNYNTAVGHYSLKTKNGINNTSVGSKSMETTTKDSNVNTAVGFQALNNVTNERNIGIGVNAGKDTKDGSNNILIGKNSDVYKINSKNQIVIGNDAKVDDNSILINQKNILPGKKDTNLGDQKYKFNKLYSNKIINGEFELKLPLPTNEIKGDRYLEVDNNGTITFVTLENILANL